MDYSYGVLENKVTFLARIEHIFAPSDVLRTNLAYMMAKHAHRAQQRKEVDESGRRVRYFEHVRRVALILMDSKVKIFTPEEVQVALLHDTLEDTEDVTPEILELAFGKSVTLGVMAMTKRLGLETKHYQRQLERVPIAPYIKLCDRVDNMRNCKVEHVGNGFLQKQLTETRDKWLPWFRETIGYPSPLLVELETIVESGGIE